MAENKLRYGKKAKNEESLKRLLKWAIRSQVLRESTGRSAALRVFDPDPFDPSLYFTGFAGKERIGKKGGIVNFYECSSETKW